MPEDVKNEDVLHWWYEHKHVYPNLSRMALDYHTIPCKSLLLFTRCDAYI
jgi:hAT family C-terminal dimerisation region